MDERGGLQCVARRFPVHQVGGETAEFDINQRQELLSGLRIALFHALEYASDAAHVPNRLPKTSHSSTRFGQTLPKPTHLERQQQLLDFLEPPFRTLHRQA